MIVAHRGATGRSAGLGANDGRRLADDRVFGAGSYAIIQFGAFGPILFIIAALVGALPIFPKRYPHLSTIVFGVTCGLFATVTAFWMLYSGFAV